ncbi:MAG: hypothetical protein WC759_05300 [Candidatus Micrarchaeia archaeon]
MIKFTLNAEKNWPVFLIISIMTAMLYIMNGISPGAPLQSFTSFWGCQPIIMIADPTPSVTEYPWVYLEDENISVKIKIYDSQSSDCKVENNTLLLHVESSVIPIKLDEERIVEIDSSAGAQKTKRIWVSGIRSERGRSYEFDTPGKKIEIMSRVEFEQFKDWNNTVSSVIDAWRTLLLLISTCSGLITIYGFAKHKTKKNRG